MFKLAHNSVHDTTLLCALAVSGHQNTAKEKSGVASIYMQAVSMPITQNIRNVYKSLSTNICPVTVLCISLLIRSYMFWLNCHHQISNTKLLKLAAIKQTYKLGKGM